MMLQNKLKKSPEFPLEQLKYSTPRLPQKAYVCMPYM